MVSAEEILINIVGRDNLSSALNKGADGFRNLTKEANTAKSEANKVGDSKASMDKLSNSTHTAAQRVQQLSNSSSSINKVGGAASNASGMVSKLGNSAQGAQGELNKVGAAGASVDKVGGAASGAAKKIDGMGAAGKKAGNETAAGMKQAQSAVYGLNSAIGSVISGFSAMEMASRSFTGAMSKEMNEKMLTRKFGLETAQNTAKEMQQIIADLPGDDQAMSNILSAASYRGNISDPGLLRELGTVTADYTILTDWLSPGIAKNTENELRDYIITGNTAMMQRDSILRNHIDKLEQAKTVEERIKLMRQLLNEEYGESVSTLDATKISWESVLGRIQMALTSLGEDFLPTIKMILDLVIDLDDKTGGWSTKIGVATLGAIALAGAVGMIISPLKNVYDLASKIGSKILDFVKPSTKTVKINCVKDPNCTTPSTTTTTTTTGTGSGKGSTAKGLIPLLTKTGTWATAGLTAGAILNDWVVGPSFDLIGQTVQRIAPDLYGGKSRQSYHDMLDMFGVGNTDYPVLSADDQVKRRAIQEGSVSGDKMKENLSGWGPFDPKNWPKIPEGITSPFPKLPSGQDVLSWLPKPGKGIAGWGGIGDALGGSIKGNPLDWLPKPVSAAGEGAGGKTGLFDQLKKDFGKGGRFELPEMFDLSKQKWKLPSITPVTSFFQRIPNQARTFLGRLPGVATQTFNSMVNNAKQGAGRVVSGVTTTVSQLPGAVYNEFMNIGQSILSAGGALYNYAYQTGLNILNGLKAALGIKSPGLMYKMVKGELGNIHGVMGEYQTTLGLGSTSIGQAVLRNFQMIQQAPSLRAAQVRTGGSNGETHIHQHGEQITIDASHMSHDELKSMLYDVLSGMNKTTIPNVKFS